GVLQNRIARLNVNGSLDAATFNSGAGTEGPVHVIMPEITGDLLVGGAFEHYDGRDRRHLARVDPNGKLKMVMTDPEWHTEFIIANYPADPQSSTDPSDRELASTIPVASLQLHVSDGQYFFQPAAGDPMYFSDPSLFINGSLW